MIVENTGAFALYEKLGYEVVQDVEVWTLDGADGDARRARGSAPAEIDLPAKHEPWQRADGTLANYDDVRGLVTETGAMLFCERSKVQPQQYTGDPEPLMRALRTYGDLYWLNLPADDPGGGRPPRARRHGRCAPARDGARPLGAALTWSACV